MTWPDKKDFAFAIVDDTDHVTTIDKIKPVYDLLFDLNIRTTKTVWIFKADPGTSNYSNLTLEDERYLDFILGLKKKGFEIALHGVRSCTSTRHQIIEGFEKFRSLFGEYPEIHINHAQNKDNLYWGLERIPKWKKILKKYDEHGTGYGHRKDLPYYWGDLSKKHIKYVRGTIVKDVNTLKVDPYMPYHLNRFPDCNQWFSSSDGHKREYFNNLISRENIDKLEKEKGLCIAYTHFGEDFVKDGRMDAETEKLLRKLAGRNGWFAPASEVLYYLSKGKVRSINLYQRFILWKNFRKDLNY